MIDYINRGFSKSDARTRATEIIEERYNKFTSEDDVLE